MRTITLGFLLATAACAPSIPLEGAACPCVAGWTCCPGVQVCAASLDRCDAIPGPVVTPAEPELGVGRSLQFSATGQNVTWDLEDSLIAGSIDSNGLYTAPPSPGVFHLVARSSFGARRVTITVRDLRLSVLAGNYGGPSAFPVDGVGDGARVSHPWNAVMSGGALWFLDQSIAPGTPLSASLRRYDPATRATTTVLQFDNPIEPVDGVLGRGGRISSMRNLTASGARALVFSDDFAIRELDTLTLELRTLRQFERGSLTNAPPLAWSESFAVVGDALYGVDSVHHQIVKWVRGAATDEIFAGLSDTAGVADGQGSAARFNNPRQLTTDGEALFVIDDEGRSLRMISFTGAVTTLFTSQGARYVAIAAVPPEWRNPAFGTPQLIISSADGLLSINQGGFATRLLANSIALESKDSLLVTTPDAIRRYDLRAGIPEVVAGRAGGEPGREDGLGPVARFALTGGVLVAMRGDTAWLYENALGRIRTVTRAGEVKTVFENVSRPNELIAMVVDDTSVYVSTYSFDPQIPGVLRRAPRMGGQWETVTTPFTLPTVHGVLNDGRLVLSGVDVTAGLYLFDGTTFTKRYDSPPQLAGVDPAGGVFSFSPDSRFIDRYDLETSTWSRVGPTLESTSARVVTSAGGHFFAMGIFNGVTDVPIVFDFDPAVGAWAPLVGRAGTGAVIPAPLPRALLHSPGGLGVFASGDLLIADIAENVVLVVE